MNPNEILNILNEVEYGWVDKNNIIHIDDFDLFFTQYKLQSPIEVLKNKVGICWDQVELERNYFEDNNFDVKTYFIVNYDNESCPTHTFLTYRYNEKCFWFEHSWSIYKGIHEYNSLKDLLIDVRYKFINDQKYKKNNLCLFEYSKPQYEISVKEFFKHCENGIKLDIDNL